MKIKTVLFLTDIFILDWYTMVNVCFSDRFTTFGWINADFAAFTFNTARRENIMSTEIQMEKHC